MSCLKTKTRESGIELLRILTMCGVVMLHYNDGKAFVFVENTINKNVLFFLESMTICAVDLFVLISGYFLSATQKRNFIKPLELVFQVIVFREITYILDCIINEWSVSIKAIILNFLPQNYFVILYCALYLISPYLNVVFTKLNKKQWNYFLVLSLVIFSIWNIMVDLMEEILGRELLGISTISMWGSQQGFNIVNFALMYIIGGYIRYCEIPKKLASKRILAMFWVTDVIVIFLWALLTENFTRLELRSAWVYHNPLVILSSVLLFLIFKQFTFSNKGINELAKGSFTCFLVHGFILGMIGIETAAKSSVLRMLIHIIVVIPCIYLISWIVYKLYSVATSWIFKFLRKFQIFQTKEYI